MEFNQILELIKTISDSKVTSFTLEEGDKKLTIKAGDKKAPQVIQVPAVAPQVAVSAPASVALAPQAMPVATEATITPQSEEAEEDKSLKAVKSPLVGTFYAASSPDAEPFVAVGDTVKKGQVIGIIEAMKLMNEIECDHDGVITEIMVNNGDMVEYGQTLFKIK